MSRSKPVDLFKPYAESFLSFAKLHPAPVDLGQAFATSARHITDKLTDMDLESASLGLIRSIAKTKAENWTDVRLLALQSTPHMSHSETLDTFSDRLEGKPQIIPAGIYHGLANLSLLR